MATRTIELDVRVNAEAAETSVTNLRTRLREMTQELQNLQPGTERFNELSRAAGELRDQIQDTNEVIRATGGPPLETLSKGLGEATRVGLNGFQAMQGAIAVFGGQSEALQATMVKLQGIMAMTQALEALGGLDQSIVKIKASFNAFFSAAKAGLQGLKGAIAATGIGLLVIAVGTLVAYWDDIKGLVSGVTKEQEKLVESSKANVGAKELELKALKNSENSLRLQGKSEKDILKIRMQKTQALIKEQEIYIQNLETRAELEIAAAERNQDITRKIIRFGLEVSAVALRALAAPIDLMLEAANQVSSLLGLGEITSFRINEQITNMIEGASEWGASLLFDADEVREKNKGVIDAEKEKLAELKSSYDGYQLELQRIDKEAAEKGRSEAEKRRAERLKELLKEANDALELEDALNAERISKLEGLDKELEEIKESGRKKARDIVMASVSDELEALNDRFVKGKISEVDFRKEKERIMIEASKSFNEKEAELARINEEMTLKAQSDAHKKWSDAAEKFRNEVLVTEEQKRRDLLKENLDKQLAQNDEFFRIGKINAEDYNKIRIELEKKYAEEIKKLDDAKLKEQTDARNKALDGIKAAFDKLSGEGFTFLSQFGSTVTSGVKAIFELTNTEFKTNTEKINAYVQAIGNTIGGLLSAISGAQKEALEANLTNVQNSFNDEAAALEDLRKRGAVTEDQYARRRYEIELAAFKKSEELKKEAFEADKALRISQTIASGAQGAVAAFASAMTIPPPAGQIIGGILAGIVGAMTLANVGIIASQQYRGGSPPQIAQPNLGGGGVGGTTITQPTGSQLFGTAGLFGNVGGSPASAGQMQVRAYVVESDITNSQNTISTIEERAEFG